MLERRADFLELLILKLKKFKVRLLERQLINPQSNFGDVTQISSRINRVAQKVVPVVSERTQLSPRKVTQEKFQLPESDQIDVLPDVVRANIVDQMNVDCRELRELRKNPFYAKYITKAKIVEASNKGFPRPSGKTNIHFVKYYKDQFDKFHQIPEYYTIKEFNNLFQKFKFYDKDQKEIQDLVKGDVVRIYNPSSGRYLYSVIYDGCNFLEPADFRKEFIIFRDGLDFTYFTDSQNGMAAGIDKIAVDLYPYREQILANLKQVYESYSSHFDVDGKRYRILFDNDEETIIDYINYNAPLNVQYVNSSYMKW